MAALKHLAIALSLLVARPAAADPIDRWRPIIAEASLRFGIPTAWIERVMRAESAGLTRLDGKPIRSRAGAIGLMQLMPATWTAMRQRLSLGTDPDDPHDNIVAGTCYLRLLYERFGYPGLFAAYNAGPARYAAFLTTGRPLPGEPIAYIARVVGPVADSNASTLAPASPPLFVIRHDANVAPTTGDDRQPSPSLFAIRKGEP